VPAGRYAQVQVVQANAGGSSFSVNLGGSAITFASNAEVEAGVIQQRLNAQNGSSSFAPVTLSAGDTISSGASLNYKFQIFEYLLP